MGNQATPVIDAVQGYTPEKVVLSGSPFVSAILGPGAYRITANAIPVYTTVPVISGSVVPPSTLTCSEGAFTSSPRGVLTYQWKRDTVDISGETSSTYASILSDIGTSITCLVTATNSSGADTGLSNALVMEAVIPSSVYEMDVMMIGGMSDPWRQMVSTAEISTIVGLEHYMKIEINEMCVNAISGYVNPDKLDINEASAYAMFLPIRLADLIVLNGDAENSVMTDWTMDSGNVQSVTTAPGDEVPDLRKGLRFFKGDDLGDGVNSQMSQVITLLAGVLTDVDTGKCYCIPGVAHMNDRGYDSLVITLDALNAADGVLDTSVWTVPTHIDNGPWATFNGDEAILNLPTLTRKVKITVLFVNQNATGSVNNNAYADDIIISLLKV